MKKANTFRISCEVIQIINYLKKIAESQFSISNGKSYYVTIIESRKKLINGDHSLAIEVLNRELKKMECYKKISKIPIDDPKNSLEEIEIIKKCINGEIDADNEISKISSFINCLEKESNSRVKK